MYGTDVT